MDQSFRRGHEINFHGTATIVHVLNEHNPGGDVCLEDANSQTCERAVGDIRMLTAGMPDVTATEACRRIQNLAAVEHAKHVGAGQPALFFPRGSRTICAMPTIGHAEADRAIAEGAQQAANAARVVGIYADGGAEYDGNLHCARCLATLSQRCQHVPAQM